MSCTRTFVTVENTTYVDGVHCHPRHGPSGPYTDPPDSWYPRVPTGEMSNPYMCYQTIRTWPDGCNKAVKPTPDPPNGCSVVPDNFGGVVSFTAACNWHDSCYGTYGNSKVLCDDGLGQRLSDACSEYYYWVIQEIKDRQPGPPTPAEAPLLAAKQAASIACLADAQVYEGGTSIFGWGPFLDAQDTAQCVIAHEKRSQYCTR